MFVFPAPLGPTKPVTAPGQTVNDIPSKASAGPNRFRSPVTSIVASLIWFVPKPVDAVSKVVVRHRRCQRLTPR